MSIARPLTGNEVKVAVSNAVAEIQRQMELDGADFSAEAFSYLSTFSSLEGDHLVYPHVEWNLEGTIEREPAKFGARGTIWVSITLDLDLGGGALISKRFGEAAPMGVELETKLFPLQQRALRTPDVLRERWISGQPLEPEAPAPESSALAPAPEPAPGPNPEAWNFVPSDSEPEPEPVSNLVGELPTLDAFSDEVEPEASTPAPSKRRGRPSKKGA